MKKHMKFLCLLLCAVLCLSLVFSSMYIAHTSSHECLGLDCHICQSVSLLREILSAGIVGIGTALFLALWISREVVLFRNRRGVSGFSPVAQKVKITA
ncbi:MAG: hypothetical protein PUB43_02290 [Oscillospiraceae bacterium]|nr:hypothetical protein [Oscillospiraceae bacterium]